MQHLVQIVGILMCWIVLVVGAQISKPHSQQIASNERRRFSNGDYSGVYGSFSASSASSVPSDFITFPDDRSINSATAAIVRHDKRGNNFNDRHKTDVDETIIQSDRVDMSQRRTVRDEESCTSGCVPLNFSKSLNTYEDYFNSLDDESQNTFDLIAPRFAGMDVERSQISRAIPAACIPEVTVVPLKLSDESDTDPTIFVFPSCTRIERCGGCCGSSLLSCQPIEKHNVSFQVFKSQHMNGRTKLIGREIIEVEKHTKCKCDCRVKESDCSEYQRYNKASCSCVCMNIEDQKKCLALPEKIWESDRCRCRCREDLKCSTDTYPDYNTCTCVETPGSRDKQLIDRRRLITKPVIYVPQTPQTYYDSTSELEPQPSQ